MFACILLNLLKHSSHSISTSGLSCKDSTARYLWWSCDIGSESATIMSSSSASSSMYKIEKKDKRLFVNAGASLRGLFTRKSKRSKKRSESDDNFVSSLLLRFCLVFLTRLGTCNCPGGGLVSWWQDLIRIWFSWHIYSISFVTVYRFCLYQVLRRLMWMIAHCLLSMLI